MTEAVSVVPIDKIKFGERSGQKTFSYHKSVTRCLLPKFIVEYNFQILRVSSQVVMYNDI